MAQDTKPVERNGFLNRMSVYGLEFAVAMITLLISVTILSIGSFTLFNFFRGNGEVGSYFSLWTAASAIVWVPVTFIFYARARAYERRNPKVAENAVQRTFVIIYQVTMILTIISFAVAAVYSALTSIVNPKDTVDFLVRVTAPSVVSALLYYGALVAFFKKPLLSRNTYLAVLTIVSLLIVVPTIVFSLMTLRGSTSDNQKEQDLSTIQASILDYKADNKKIPDSLSDLNLSGEVGDNLGDYQYEKVSDTRYELCTEFSEDKQANTYGSNPNPGYTQYPSFYNHGTGKRCFKLTTESYNAYDYDNSY